MITKINLCGIWNFELDPDKEGLNNSYFQKEFFDTINLPTTTSEAKKGIANSECNTGYLTDPYKFEGWAWYSKDIQVPSQYNGKIIKLHLERTRISNVWVDDIYVGTCNSLCSSHYYDLTPIISKDKCKLTIMTDNTAYPTNGGHMTSADTQTNWNGITGDISLEIYETSYISNIKTYTDVNTKSVVIKGNLIGAENAILNVWANDNIKEFQKCKYEISGSNIQITYTLGDDALLWSEHSPHLYNLQFELECGGKITDKNSVTFGFHEFKAAGSSFTINGIKTFLRGKHDGMIFPLTGYAPTDVESWLRVMKTAKDYGINHYRFHTCCPPEAAFTAADQLGIYLEPEVPFWGTITSPKDENHNEEMQQYLINEGYRVLDEFGNHPSFVMMSLGNELWGDKNVLNEILGKYKEYDDRHLYVQGCNNFQFSPCILENDDFFSGVRFSRDRLFRGSYAMCDAPQGHIQTQMPAASHNYDEIIRPKHKIDEQKNGSETIQIQYETGVKTVELSDEKELIPNVPVISHEVGQYSVSPNFNEIQKYTGVLKARNFEVFRERLEKKNLISKAENYIKASGKLAAECYKSEIETALRSKELAGFQLLDLQDFSGQGTALVGMLDAFMESKGIISSDEWKNFCSDAVLLAEFSKYIYKSGEQLKVSAKISYYRPQIIENAELIISLYSDDTTIYSSTVSVGNINASKLSELYTFSIKMPEYSEPQKLSLSLKIKGTQIQNNWELWAYPECPNTEQPQDIIVTKDFEKACEALADGKKVIFMPLMSGNPNSIEGTYCTDFWCYPMFRSISESMGKAVPVGTMGLLINNTHPALKYFSSEFYTTPQWWDIILNSRSTILDNTDLQPIVLTIDNFERNHRLGLIFEMTIANGKLLVCTAELSKIKDSITAQWLMYSLISYVKSESFNPEMNLSGIELKKLFNKTM